MPEIASLMSRSEELFRELDKLPFGKRVDAINQMRKQLHEHSPFVDEPVDCVQWVCGDDVEANDYNPNTVAPPEMRLLKLSIEADGFTQPIVTYQDQEEHFVVVDGFHRQRIGKKDKIIRKRLHGYLPVVYINHGRSDLSDRVAATIRHNRARGVHSVLPMTDIIVNLLKAGWDEHDVERELGMDADEVLRFKQVSGLPELFREHDYSKSWD